MGKYSILEANVFSIFGSIGWTSQAIKTYPSNYVAVNTNNEDFIRVTIIPSGEGVNFTSVSGLLNIDIFVKSGLGPNAIAIIADKLDTFLVTKSVGTSTGVTQFKNSSLTISGIDKDNPALFRAIYTIPFNYFGV